MAIRARTFTYAVSLDREGGASSDRGGEPLEPDETWTPEHLMLLGLVRCTLTSLAYHAKLAGIEVEATADASGVVTRREEDGRYAFVEVEVRAELTLTPPPERVRELLALGERDCFVGASLRVAPTYSWTVNGEEVR
jgi:organic hydroperoxide reductase OsmC/OhrA